MSLNCQMLSNVLFCLRPKDIQSTVREDEGNQKKFTFEKLNSNYQNISAWDRFYVQYD